MGKSAAYRFVDDLMVVRHGAQTPPDDEWQDLLAAMGAHEPLTRILVWSPAAAISSRQRAQVGAVTTRRKLRVAVVSDSTVVRGAATAVGWLTGKLVRGFSVDNVDGAATFLELDGDIRRRAIEALEQLHQEVAD